MNSAEFAETSQEESKKKDKDCNYYCIGKFKEHCIANNRYKEIHLPTSFNSDTIHHENHAVDAAARRYFFIEEEFPWLKNLSFSNATIEIKDGAPFFSGNLLKGTWYGRSLFQFGGVIDYRSNISDDIMFLDKVENKPRLPRLLLNNEEFLEMENSRISGMAKIASIIGWDEFDTCGAHAGFYFINHEKIERRLVGTELSYGPYEQPEISVLQELLYSMSKRVSNKNMWPTDVKLINPRRYKMKSKNLDFSDFIESSNNPLWDVPEPFEVDEDYEKLRVYGKKY